MRKNEENNENVYYNGTQLYNFSSYNGFDFPISTQYEYSRNAYLHNSKWNNRISYMFSNG